MIVPHNRREYEGMFSCRRVYSIIGIQESFYQWIDDEKRVI
jgi:hypothetical protein